MNCKIFLSIVAVMLFSGISDGTLVISTAKNGILSLGNSFEKSFSVNNVYNIAEQSFLLLKDLQTVNSLLSGTSAGNSELKELSNSMKNLQSNVNLIREELDKLFEATKAITSDVKLLESCERSYQLYLRNPNIKSYADQVRNCQGILPAVTSITNLLQGKSLSVGFESIFQQLYTSVSYCNGKAMMKIYSYLLYYQFVGYKILELSMELNVGKESLSFIEQYNTSWTEIKENVVREQDKCAKDCTGLKRFINEKANQMSNPDQLRKLLNETMPWNTYSIFNFKSDGSYILLDFTSGVQRYERLIANRKQLILAAQKSAGSGYTLNAFTNFWPSDNELGDVKKANYCNLVKITYNIYEMVSKALANSSLVSVTSSHEISLQIRIPCSDIQHGTAGLTCGLRLHPSASSSITGHNMIYVFQLVFVFSFWAYL